MTDRPTIEDMLAVADDMSVTPLVQDILIKLLTLLVNVEPDENGEVPGGFYMTARPVSEYGVSVSACYLSEGAADLLVLAGSNDDKLTRRRHIADALIASKGEEAAE